MRSIPLSFLLLFLLAAMVTAQDRPRTGSPTGKHKDRIRMSPPGKETSREKPDGTKEGEEQKPAPVLKDEFELAVEKMDGWPNAQARDAASMLALRGPDIESRMIELLQGAPPGRTAGIAFVLGEVGGDAALAAVQNVAARLEMTEYLSVVFDAIGKLDGANGVNRVLPFLRHARRPARLAAENWLRGHLDASYAPRLTMMIDEPNRGARISAFRLLADVAQEQAVELAKTHLGDELPEVALISAETLSEAADAEIIEYLNRSVGTIAARASAYATLSLILIEDRTGVRHYTEESIEKLLGTRGLKAPDKLNRGASAIALADIGYDSEMPAVDAVLDRDVTLTLLDTLGGPTFFKDFSSFSELARERFGKLTGIRERRPTPALWDWWSNNEAGFVARRALGHLMIDALDVFRVKARSLVEPALPTTLFSTEPEDASGPETVGMGFVLLFPEEARELAELISDELMSLPDVGAVDSTRIFSDGEDGALFGPSVVITISVRNRSRTVLGRKTPPPREIATVLAHLDELRSEYAWQRYWDRNAYPRYEDFIRAEVEFHSREFSKELRQIHLKDLVLGALDDLPTVAERTAALSTLADLSVPLNDSEAYRLAKLLAEEGGEPTPFAERVVEVLIGAEKPLVLPIIADWAEMNAGPRSRELFVRALVSCGAAEVLRSARSNRPFVRRCAMRAASQVIEGPELEAVLADGVDDTFSPVRREALLSLGRAGTPGAVGVLTASLDDPDDEVKAAAIEALGLLRTPEVIVVLSRQLASEDLARRVASVRALCSTGLPEAQAPVLQALKSDSSPLVRGVAAREIVQFGESALMGLSEILMDPAEDAAVRSQAVDAMVRIGGDHVAPVLTALLDDPSDEVADAAAFALAQLCNKAAVPRLIEALDAGRNGVRALASLEQLSCRSFSSALSDELPAIYRGWWGDSKLQPESRWFVEALERKGVDAGELPGFEDGVPAEGAVPALLTALADENWFIRANADLWLRRITAEEFGEVSRFTAPDQMIRIQTLWKSWWEAR